MIIKGVDKKFCRISNGVLEKFNSLANQTPNKPLRNL